MSMPAKKPASGTEARMNAEVRLRLSNQRERPKEERFR